MLQEIGSGLREDALELEYRGEQTRGQALEEYLTNVCDNLGLIASITEDKADMDFLLMIVGSYLIAVKEGELTKGALPPNELFDTNLFPMLDAEEDIVVEALEETADGEG